MKNRNIAECLASVSWADEIIVVDAESTDTTIEIAKTLHAKDILAAMERIFSFQDVCPSASDASMGVLA